MAVTKLDVCNMALGFIGTRTISQTELTNLSSPEAVQCSLYWDRARRAVLEDYPYAFAIRRLSLSEMGTVPAVYQSWSKAYTYPSNPEALKILSVHKGTEGERLPFAVEHTDNTTRIILTDTANAQCVCVVDVTDLTLWDEKFISAMSLKLAVLSSTALLKNNPQKIQELMQLYQVSIPKSGWDEGGWAVAETNSKLGVMNMALGLVGARMITSVTENCDEAVQCNLHWERARRAVLRDYPYRFAIHRAALTARVIPAVHGGEWSKAYTFPADALRVLSVHNGTDKETRQPFAVEYTSTGTAILCNVATGAEATYIADVPDTSLWDEKFTAAMTRRLAMQIAGALLPAEKMQGKMQELSQLYQMSLPGPPMTEENWAVEADVTRLNVCNMALSFAGAKMISSTAENSQEALSCSLHWDNARRSALRDFPYRFAQRRFQLEAVTMPDLYARQWRYAYEMPECLKIVRVHDGFDRIHRIPFALENVDGQMVIFCNVPNAMATCTIDIEDTSKWDEMFITMMARKLAIFIFPALFTRGEAGRNEPKRA